LTLFQSNCLKANTRKGIVREWHSGTAAGA
jgi:hypothetical protein